MQEIVGYMTIGPLISSWCIWIFTSICDMFFKFILDERVYTNTDNKNTNVLVIILKQIVDKYWYSKRLELFEGKMYPAGLIIGMNFLAYTNTEATPLAFRQTKTTVRVLRWRWLPPLIPDDDINGLSNDIGKGMIRVSRRCNDNWNFMHEISYPIGISHETKMACLDMANKLAEAVKEKKGQARIILSGPPGVGKSTSIRGLTLLMNAILVPTFDPTRKGFNIFNVQSELRMTGNTRMIIICIEEFDGILNRLNDDSKILDASAEVIDKASWNNMMDFLQYIPNIVVIMTSNLDFHALDALDLPHGGALLREGRITHRFEMHEQKI